jgi:hypothetical protein
MPEQRASSAQKPNVSNNGGDVHRVDRLAIAASFVVIFATSLVAQDSPTPRIEITQTDITKISPIRSVSLALFGIALGDRTDAAQEQAKAAGFRPEAVTTPQKDGSRFVRVFDSSEKELFGFKDEGGTVTALTLRNDLAPRLPGESSKLFNASIMEKESALRLRLLGREDSRSVDQPRGTSITSVTISYDKEGISLTQSYVGRMGDLPPTIHLVMPAKAR